MATLDDAAGLALDMPEAYEAERRGNRTFFVAGKAFGWERPFSKADIKRFGSTTPPAGPILAVRVLDLQEKEAVLSSNAKGLFTIPHFDGYAAVLIALPAVGKRALRTAVVDAWLAMAPAALADGYLRRSGGLAARSRPARDARGERPQ
jgi:hypothetical protein